MRKINLLFIALLGFSMTLSAQNAPIDFEAGGFGAEWTWAVFENDTNPPLEIIANPDPSGANTSTTVAQFTALATGAPFAGCESMLATDLGVYTLSEENSIVKIMVWKTNISNVGIKMVTTSLGALPELLVPNTLTNQWEEITFDFSGYIDNAIYAIEDVAQIVVFPDFMDRDEDHVSYFDNITIGDGTSSSDPCPSPDAIICDNIDDYELGPMNGQGAHWSTWGGTLGGADDGIVTDEQAFSNSNSVLIAEGQTQDVLLLLGNQTEGVWDISWMEYVPANATAYYNIQEDEVPGVAWNLDVYFNQEGGGAPGSGIVTTTGDMFTYPEDEWFAVEMSIDLDADLISLSIDGIVVMSDAIYTGNIGSINFFSVDATNRYYLDDVVWDGEPGAAPCPDPGAIICDNFDDYTLDMIAAQAAHWADWPGGTTTSMVSEEQAFSNTQSLHIGAGGAEDNLLLLGDQTAGVWMVDFMAYVPAGSTGYYNMQNVEATGQWNFDIFFNAAGAGDYQEGQVSISTFTYPEDQWFEMKHTVDLNNLTVVVELDGTVIHSGPYIGDMVGAVNFYSFDAVTNSLFIDDVIVNGNPDVGLIEYTESAFTVYPNPTEDMLTIAGDAQIDAVLLRDVLGAVVRQLDTPFSNQVTIDVADLTKGVYFVEVRVGDVINVSRVIKK